MPDLNLAWIPRFVLGEIEIAFSYPLTRWNPGARTEGRMLTSISGVNGASLRVRKYLLNFAIRYTEDEWPLIMSLFQYAQLGDSFLWFPQAQDPAIADSLTVFLESPRVAEGIQPVRDSIMQWMFTQQMTISRTTAPWDIEYFRLPEEIEI